MLEQFVYWTEGMDVTRTKMDSDASCSETKDNVLQNSTEMKIPLSHVAQ